MGEGSGAAWIAWPVLPRGIPNQAMTCGSFVQEEAENCEFRSQEFRFVIVGVNVDVLTSEFQSVVSVERKLSVAFISYHWCCLEDQRTTERKVKSKAVHRTRLTFTPEP